MTLEGKSSFQPFMLCTGPKEALDDTEVAQPALFVAGLAAAERLRSEVSAKRSRREQGRRGLASPGNFQGTSVKWERDEVINTRMR